MKCLDSDIWIKLAVHGGDHHGRDTKRSYVGICQSLKTNEQVAAASPYSLANILEENNEKKTHTSENTNKLLSGEKLFLPTRMPRTHTRKMP